MLLSASIFQEDAMSRLVKPTTSLEDRIAERLDQMRAELETLPPGNRRRDQIERTIRQAETYTHMNDWIGSPGLRAPD